MDVENVKVRFKNMFQAYKEYKADLKNPPTGGGEPLARKPYFDTFDIYLADDSRIQGVPKESLELGWNLIFFDLKIGRRHFRNWHRQSCCCRCGEIWSHWCLGLFPAAAGKIFLSTIAASFSSGFTDGRWSHIQWRWFAAAVAKIVFRNSDVG